MRRFTSSAEDILLAWRYCLNFIDLIHSHSNNPCPKMKIHLNYQVADITFAPSSFNAFMIILFVNCIYDNK